MKAQSTLEFVGAFLIFLLSVIGILTLATSEIPEFSSYTDVAEKNLELKRTTDILMESEGYYEDGSNNGTNWEENVKNTVTPGLVSRPYYIDYNKLRKFETFGSQVYNYSSLKDDLNLDHRYSFNFTLFPIVDTQRSFIRTMPPEHPGIIEPKTDYYNNSENRVHYGSILINGTERKFLVTAYDGRYNTTYVTESWNFSKVDPQGEGDILLQEPEFGEFILDDFQNRARKPGASLILRTSLLEYGRDSETATGSIEKISRYPILNHTDSSNEIVRMEVLAW